MGVFVVHLHSDHISQIDFVYNSILSVFFTASMHSIERIQVHSLKSYWNDELDRLKNDSIFGTACG